VSERPADLAAYHASLFGSALRAARWELERLRASGLEGIAINIAAASRALDLAEAEVSAVTRRWGPPPGSRALPGDVPEVEGAPSAEAPGSQGRPPSQRA